MCGVHVWWEGGEGSDGVWAHSGKNFTSQHMPLKSRNDAGIINALLNVNISKELWNLTAFWNSDHDVKCFNCDPKRF